MLLHRKKTQCCIFNVFTQQTQTEEEGEIVNINITLISHHLDKQLYGDSVPSIQQYQHNNLFRSTPSYGYSSINQKQFNNTFIDSSHSIYQFLRSTYTFTTQQQLTINAAASERQRASAQHMSCDPIQQVSKLCVTTVTSVSSGSNQYKRTSSCSGTLSLSLLLFHDSRG